MSEGGKCGERRPLFSLRWLLRKSSRSSDKQVTTSKSCDLTDTHSTAGVECPPSHLLWKLLPPPAGRKMPLRASFSCNDMQGLTAAQGLTNSESSREVSLLSPEEPIVKHHPLSQSSASRLNAPPCGPPCKLCLGRVPALHTPLQDCGCSFCTECLGQWLVICIREGRVPVPCPDAGCKGSILVSEIKEIAGEDAMYMFQRYKLNLDVSLDPGRVWCPSAGCETVCALQPSSRPHRVSCHTCGLHFCSGCRLQWHAAPCPPTPTLLQEDTEGCVVKRCPVCRVPIEKEAGCAQMMCYRCRHVFCWHCLASLDDDFLLRHYDKGPCRNKLGHSRASILWHRTQVVGIFAGFSLLLLLASPFLLLAAPCILCCPRKPPTPL